MIEKGIKLVCIDFQEEFTNEKGKCYGGAESINFVKNIFVPFLSKNEIKTYEIVSDYRFVENRYPRKGDNRLICNPDDFGYESEIPSEVKYENVWVKSMNSPIWVRENGGIGGKLPGAPYQDPKVWGEWLEKTLGDPDNIDYVLVFGLTLDCCVLCCVQELYWRGYKVKILFEGTDPRGKSPEEIKKRKEYMCFEHSSVKIFSEFTFWKDEKEKIEMFLKSKKSIL